MKVTRTSMITGVVRTIDVPLSPSQLQEIERGTPVEHVVPYLELPYKQFLRTGIIEDEWISLITGNSHFGCD